MDPKSLYRIERMNYIFGAVLFALSAALFGKYLSLGVGAGVVLTCVNFSIIRRLVVRLLDSPPEKRAATAFYFIPKMSGLLAAVALAIYFLPISPIGLGIGFSVFLLSIMVESIRFVTGSTIST